MPPTPHARQPCGQRACGSDTRRVPGPLPGSPQREARTEPGAAGRRTPLSPQQRFDPLLKVITARDPATSAPRGPESHRVLPFRSQTPGPNP
jgi:hypothetical protein